MASHSTEAPKGRVSLLPSTLQSDLLPPLMRFYCFDHKHQAAGCRGAAANAQILLGKPVCLRYKTNKPAQLCIRHDAEMKEEKK